MPLTKMNDMRNNWFISIYNKKTFLSRSNVVWHSMRMKKPSSESMVGVNLKKTLQYQSKIQVQNKYLFQGMQQDSA